MGEPPSSQERAVWSTSRGLGTSRAIETARRTAQKASWKKLVITGAENAGLAKKIPEVFEISGSLASSSLMPDDARIRPIAAAAP